MADASFLQSSFAGGEVSLAMQGRYDDPRYRTFMKACLNAMPTETAAWCRRGGTLHCGHTRSGGQGRVIAFDFDRAAPYNIELTAGYFRYRAGATLVTDAAQAVVAISAANPAVVQVATAPATGKTVVFSGLGTNNPLLQNRQFTITNVDGTHFSLQDALTGANIDGATLGAFVSGSVAVVSEAATPYVGTAWQNVRMVQSDRQDVNGSVIEGIFLHPAVKPYVLTVNSLPTGTSFATFSFAAASFKDGPYFDPVPGGLQATPSAKIGNITLTLSFPAYDATRSYSLGDYATTGGVNYKSLTDANVGNAPAGSPANWVAVAASDAIGPRGFQGTDTGRHVRLFSEPQIWVSGTSYAVGDVVAFGGAGARFENATYWKSLAGSNTTTPGTDTTKWALFPAGAIWTWGKITGLSNVIDRALAGSASLGDMTGGGGLAAAFNGVFSKTAATSARGVVFAQPGVTGTAYTLTTYIGKNYSGATDQKISQATVYPPTDQGVGFARFQFPAQPDQDAIPTVTVNLRGKASAPANSADGTLLGTTTTVSPNSAITVASNDQATAWKYVWIEIVTTFTIGGSSGSPFTYSMVNNAAQLSLFGPPGSGTSQGVTIQLVGDALLYTVPVRTWRLGLYSDPTGWPSCGTYHEGRLWLSGAVGNRIDASRSNEPYNFAPTNPDGSVPDNAAISYMFNAPDINPIFWMQPDDKGLVCGTLGGEWLVQATTLNAALTPKTIQAHRVTKNGCANIEPRRTDLTLTIVQRYRGNVLEYFADVYSGKFSAQNLSYFCKHLTKPLIAEIGWQRELVPVLWQRMDNGSLAGVTYQRESAVSSQPPQMMGGHRHALGSGRTVESITVGATQDGALDALVMVTNDAATNIRHVEMMTPVFEEADDPATAWLLDDAVEPSSTVSSQAPAAGAPYGGLTLYGLWHLNGKTVTVTAGALDCGATTDANGLPTVVDFLVANGSLFVPYGDGVSGGSGLGLFTADFVATNPQITVGFTYTSDGQIVRPHLPPESGARNGPAFGKEMRIASYAIKTIKSAGLSIGTGFGKLLPVLFKGMDAKALASNATSTGTYWDRIDENDSRDGSEICWRVTRPKPAIVTSVGGFLQTKDQ